MWMHLVLEFMLTWMLISFVSLPLLALVEGYSRRVGFGHKA